MTSNVAKMMISVFDRVISIVGKGQNAGYQHFLLILQCFQNTSFSGSLKLGIVWLRVDEYAKSFDLWQSAQAIIGRKF